MVSGRRDGGAVLAECVQSALETDALQVRFVKAGGFGHDTTRQVVGNEERQHFLARHRRTLAAQGFHAQSRLDIAQAHLQTPAPRIGFGQFVNGKELGIQQRRHQHNLTGAETGHIDGESQEAHLDPFGQETPLLVGENLRLLIATPPGEESVVLAQPLGLAKIHFAPLVQSSDDIHGPLLQAGHRGVFSIGPIAHENISALETLPHLAEEPQIVHVKIAGDNVQNGSTGQREEHRQLHHWKATALFLG